MSVSAQPGSCPTRIACTAAIVLGLFCLFLPSDSAATLPPGEPAPPLGWEEEITEGFDPPIEQVLVQEWFIEDEKFNHYVEDWGQGAFDVLEKLWNDEKWRGYHSRILLCMSAVDTERAQTFLKVQFKVYANKEELPRPERASFNIIINKMHETSPESLQTLARKYAMDASPDVQHVLIHNVLWRAASKESLDTLRQIYDARVYHGHEESLAWVIDHVKGLMRAQEPMDAVLEAERTDKP